MTDELFPMEDKAAHRVEFVGFESPSMVEPTTGGRRHEQAKLPAPAKPRRRRVTRPRKRAHPVKVLFDDREFAKLNAQAGAQGLALPDLVRLRALRDPRVRNRQAVSVSEDLFERGNVVEVTMVRLTAQLSPEMEQRVSTYFSPEGRFVSDPRGDRRRFTAFPVRTNVFGWFGQILSELVGARRLGQGATPSAET